MRVEGQRRAEPAAGAVGRTGFISRSCLLLLRLITGAQQVSLNTRSLDKSSDRTDGFGQTVTSSSSWKYPGSVLVRVTSRIVLVFKDKGNVHEVTRTQDETGLQLVNNVRHAIDRDS
jgi:hypothetical protein